LTEANVACFAAQEDNAIDASLAEEPAVVAGAHTEFVAEAFERFAAIDRDRTLRGLRKR
jgi:hypothetical protein